MWLFLAFLIVPLVEIALFIQIGGLIGLWPTLLIVVLTAVIGTWLVRTQGAAVLGNLQRSLSEMDDPTEPLAHGAMILFAGALLLTPGFFTDSIGFALLMPRVRVAAFAFLKRHVRMRRHDTHRPHASPYRSRRGPDIIDADYEEVPPSDAPQAKRPTHDTPERTRH